VIGAINDDTVTSVVKIANITDVNVLANYLRLRDQVSQLKIRSTVTMNHTKRIKYTSYFIVRELMTNLEKVF
jgi:hypothetical protein